ncbi:fungal-specific transcription factor domain-containing protein [Dendryphion nanum]|uniref:Fungal-specific transcription factor domain-containing protein n=1 Tax=Dendryphion nanum TaxID=256645 RepID=A0A9P9E8M2_9PLEO|nr:fungal-specific transcription factor domain-containing protein [Dendryphion nanum]
MPRPKKPGAAEPKKRSRTGCWPCKARKVKCGEERPRCANCERQGETCDYSIRLNWGGRTKRNPENSGSTASSATNSPYESTFSFEQNVSPLFPPTVPEAPVSPANFIYHSRARSATSVPTSDVPMVDPELMAMSGGQPQPALTAGGLFGQGSSFAHDISFDSSSRALQVPNDHYRINFDYPSPSASNFDSPGYIATANADAPLSPPSMPPPMRSPQYNTQSNRQVGDSNEYMYTTHKRSQSAESPAATSEHNHSSMSTSDTYSPYPVGSEDAYTRTAPKPQTMSYPPSDIRRLSVQSLLAGPPGEVASGYSHEGHLGRQYPLQDSDTTIYGYDLGLPDLDSPKNIDENAIQMFSPRSGNHQGFGDDSIYGNADTHAKDMAFEHGGYYSKPVPIRIPKSLEPLPQLLHESPMNLIYFHHFINHTARILIPHDCEQNPFRQILPEMAIRDENILSLLLAFSASHRARLLGHREPANRIAEWVKDVFPRLRETLANSNGHISNETLAPAIMMASLQIISPDAFEVSVSWQDHLSIARQMIIARGGPGGMDRHDRVAYFLSRWFAYLDVLGSLSGNKNDQPLGSFYWSSENASADEDYQIDCLMGFTTRCVGILARIAELAKYCEQQRIDEDGNVREDWRPEPKIVEQAIQIRRALEQGLSDHVVYKGCNHRSMDSSESEGAWDATEIYATNEMFHWAGLIHLYRRVLGKPAMDSEVQHAVREIIGLLYKVRRGSTAEACLLFPMFAAGCDAKDDGQRDKIMERLRSVEGFGMTQVNKARSLMQKVWDTGKPWESLVSGEFFG